MENNIVRGPKISEATIKNINQTFNKYLLNVMKNHPKKILMIDAESGDHYTCQDLIDKSSYFLKYLKEFQLKSDSRIAIISENRLEYPSVLLAGLRYGKTCALISPLYAARELEHAFNISRPSIAFTSSKTFSKVKSLQLSCPFLEHIINLDEMDKLCDAYNFDANDSHDDFEENNETTTAIILYSSGTTGVSKGVLLSHKSLILLMEIFRSDKFIEFAEDNVVSGILPICHAFGFYCLSLSLVLGHTYVIIKRFNNTLFLNYIEKYRINSLYTVPFLTLFLAKDPLIENYNLSCINFISNGGGMIRKSVVETLQKRFTSCQIMQNYGMTETTSMCISTLRTSDPFATGRLVPGMIAKIVDVNDGSILGPMQKGEFCIKGPLLMKGYCQTTLKMQIVGVDSEGWFHSGDIAYFDEYENFYIIDRIKEIIKYKGYQVPPSEIEILLLQHPFVELAGVVGVPDEQVGELPRAYVVKKSGSNITEEDLIQYVADNLSPMKKLRGGLKFVDNLPRTGSGKIERKELKKWVAAGI